MRPGHIMAALMAAALVGQAAPARADGEFLQLDVSRSTSVAVLSVARDPYSVATSLVDDGEDRRLALTGSRALLLGAGWTARLGPTVALTRDDDGTDTEAGVALAVERYTPTSFGSLYLLGEASSIDRSWFVTAQAGFARGWGLELSRGGSRTYDETSLAVTRRLSGTSVSLRGGYRLDAGDVFVGLSVNTF